MIAWRVLPLLLLATACTAGRAAAPVAMPPPDDWERLVRQAEGQAQAGAHAEAARLFTEVAEDPDSGFTDRALLGLTRILCQPAYAGRDYRQAFLVADRLVRDFPDSPYASEGRAWHDLLVAYLSITRELERRTRELEQLARTDELRTQELERLRRVDLELERRTRELERRPQQLERLRRVELELERRTQELERRTQELEQRTQELERLKRLDLELEQQKRKP